MTLRPPWYDAFQKWLEPSAPLMIALMVGISILGFWLIVKQEWAALALYLVYLLSP